MENLIRGNFKVFNDTSSPIYTSPLLSTVIKYSTFTESQSHTVLWTPATGKRIYLTAIGSSATATLTAFLERASDLIWLVVRENPYTQSFMSPIVFEPNESIYLSMTISSLTFDITLIGYEL